jgi:pilus assembly protein CpaF
VFSLVITERGGAQRQLDFDAAELSIGRVEENDVVLPRTNVSKRHARLVLKDERYVLIDLKSTNGTYVNGRRIAAPMIVGAGDKIYVGDFILSLLEPSRSRLADSRPRPSTLPAPRSPFTEPPPASLSTPPPPPGHTLTEARIPGPLTEPTPLPAPRPSPPLRLPLSEPTAAEPLAPFAVRSPLLDGAAPARRSGGPPPPPPQARLTPQPFPAPTPLRPLSSEPPIPPAPPVTEERPTADRPRRPSGAPPGRMPSVPPRVQDPDSGQGPATSPAVLAPSVRLQGALQTLMERLSARMDVSEPHERAFPSEQQRVLESLIDELAAEGVTGPDLDRRFLQQAAISEAAGLGPLDRLLNNRSVREVVVDGPSRILADVGGGLSPVSSFFSSSRAVQDVLERLFARAGKSPGGGPVSSVQLPDGTHVQVLQPPLSPAGPLITIRCPLRTTVSADGLVTEGALSVDMLSLLRSAVRARLNVLVAGVTGAGVSTMLSALGSLCQDHERIVTLQEAPTLAIAHPHVLSLRLGGDGVPALSEVLRHAARLRADRLVIDDLGAADALAVLTYASSSRGVLLGMHAPTPAAALEQLELFAQVSLAGARSSLASVLAQAFGLLVHVGFDASGTRRVLSIAELRGARDSTLDVTLLHRWDGGWKSSEHKPSFG